MNTNVFRLYDFLMAKCNIIMRKVLTKDIPAVTNVSVGSISGRKEGVSGSVRFIFALRRKRNYFCETDGETLCRSVLSEARSEQYNLQHNLGDTHGTS